MANEKHLAILKKGVKVWNDWRKKNFGTLPDLVGANLSKARLSNADLNKADLSGAKLSNAFLGRADLSGAILNGADLSEAHLPHNDLASATGLEAVLHDGPSTIGIDTIYLSNGIFRRLFCVGQEFRSRSLFR